MESLNLHQCFQRVNINSFVVQDIVGLLDAKSKQAATFSIDKSPLMFVAIDPSFIELIRHCYLTHKSVNMKASALTGLIVAVEPIE